MIRKRAEQLYKYVIIGQAFGVALYMLYLLPNHNHNKNPQEDIQMLLLRNLSSLSADVKEISHLLQTKMEDNMRRNNGYQVQQFYQEIPVSTIIRRNTYNNHNSFTLNLTLSTRLAHYTVCLKGLRNERMHLILHNTFCLSHSPTVLLYVFSSPKNFRRRQFIRATWGKERNYGIYTVGIVFILGQDKNASHSKDIKEEAIEYNDIVQASFVDNYHNLTLKGIAAIKWILAYCAKVQYVIKADDDIIVDVQMLINLMKSRSILGKPKVLCVHVEKGLVDRNIESKYYIPYEVLPNLYRYPQFCRGSFYGYPASFLMNMDMIASRIPLFPLEDVFFTGLVIPHIQLHRVMYANIGAYWCNMHTGFCHNSDAVIVYFEPRPEEAQNIIRSIQKRHKAQS